MTILFMAIFGTWGISNNYAYWYPEEAETYRKRCTKRQILFIPITIIMDLLLIFFYYW